MSVYENWDDHHDESSQFFIVWSDDRVGLVGMAARGHCEREGPIACDGRDEVGTSSDEAKPNLPYYRVDI